MRKYLFWDLDLKVKIPLLLGPYARKWKRLCVLVEVVAFMKRKCKTLLVKVWDTGCQPQMRSCEDWSRVLVDLILTTGFFSGHTSFPPWSKSKLRSQVTANYFSLWCCVLSSYMDPPYSSSENSFCPILSSSDLRRISSLGCKGGWLVGQFVILKLIAYAAALIGESGSNSDRSIHDQRSRSSNTCP